MKKTQAVNLSVVLKRLKLTTVERLLPDLLPVAEKEAW